MKRRASLAAAGIGLALPLAAKAQVVNFHAANNGNGPNGYDGLFVGQGAYSDPGHNIWNGFGAMPGPGSTYFYGASNPWSGNPGNPYAAFIASTNPNVFGSSTGTVLFGTPGTVPTTSSATTVNPAGNATSSGAFTSITLSENVGSDNGAQTNTVQGQPSFLLGNAVVANGTSPNETFVLHNVPAGTYQLYLYGANYNNDRGTLFAVSSGTADQGISGTLNTNPSDNAAFQPGQTFVEGGNYVIFNGVHPDGSGNITITASPNPADGQGNSNMSGETDVNGFQLVTISVPEPASVGLLGIGALGLLTRRRRRT